MSRREQTNRSVNRAPTACSCSSIAEDFGHLEGGGQCFSQLSGERWAAERGPFGVAQRCHASADRWRSGGMHDRTGPQSDSAKLSSEGLAIGITGGRKIHCDGVRVSVSTRPSGNRLSSFPVAASIGRLAKSHPWRRQSTVGATTGPSCRPLHSAACRAWRVRRAITWIWLMSRCIWRQAFSRRRCTLA